MKEKFAYYFKIWILMSKNSFLSYLQNRLSFVIFLAGKVIRFSFYLVFITFLLRSTESLVGYNLDQTLFFFITFSLIDTAAQFLFRGVYRFRSLVVDGGFDLVLLKPTSALFRSLFGGADILDLFSIPPLIILGGLVGRSLDPSFPEIILYLVMVINAVVLSGAFHIVAISLGIVTLEIDHTIMIYRDMTSLGRFPIDIYKEPLKSTLTFLIPVGIMMTFPAKVLMGLLSPVGVLISVIFAVFALYVSIKLWNYALRYYTSASS